MIRRRKTNKFDFILFTAIIILTLVAFYQIKPYIIRSNKKVHSRINNYPYKTTNKSTILYKKYFKELKTILDKETVDEEAYAKKVVQCFAADFYDTNSKENKLDIGGLDYLHPSIVDDFKEKATNSYYKYISHKKNKIKVYNTEVLDLKRIKYSESGVHDLLAFEVKLKLTTNKKKHKLVFNLIHDENRLNIIKIKKA